MSTTEPIRDKNQIKAFAEYWLKRGKPRNYALIVLGVCTALRIGDLLQLRWKDVYDFECEEFRLHIAVDEEKTCKRSIIALSEQATHALRLCFPHRRGEYVFASNRGDEGAITRVQAWRIIRTAAEATGLEGRIACHSLRKTAGYHLWKSGALPVLLMDIFNHSSYEVTRRYLGIAQDDRDQVYLDLSLF